MNIKLSEAISKGVITLGKTEKEDQYVLFVITADKEFAIPMLKSGKTGYAYIPEDIEEEEYDILSSIVEEIKKNKVYKGLPNFRPLLRNAPEHSKVIGAIVIGSFLEAKSVQPRNLEEVARKFGYILDLDVSAGEVEKKDYSELMKDPEVKLMFDRDAKALAKDGVTFESLSMQFKMAYETIEAGEHLGVVITGPTGTGKSVGFRALANHAGAPCLLIQVTGGTTVEDFEGQFIPSEGGYTFVPGPLLKAFILGYWILVDEISFGNPQVLATLNKYVDGSKKIIVNGKTYWRNPNFVVGVTMNPGYVGTEKLNTALKNRFSKISVPRLDEKEFVRRMKAYSKGLGHEFSDEFFKRIYKFANYVEKTGNGPQYHEDICFSVRNAQRVVSGCYNKRRNFDEFFTLFKLNYLNDLNCDNDNSEKLVDFYENPDVVSQVRGIYECYDLAEVQTIDVSAKFADIIDVEATDADDDGKGKKADINALFDGISRDAGFTV